MELIVKDQTNKENDVEPKPFGTIPHVHGLTCVEYEAQFSAICAVGAAPFAGTVSIEYGPGLRLLEFESFEDWLRRISNQRHTIESFTRMVTNAFVRTVAPDYAVVQIKATTQVHGPVTATIGYEKPEGKA